MSVHEFGRQIVVEAPEWGVELSRWRLEQQRHT